MKSASEVGFNGTVSCGKAKIIFRHGLDTKQFKEFIHLQPFNQFFWCETEEMLLYRNKEGQFYKISFEDYEL